jgi:hypothetical protein
MRRRPLDWNFLTSKWSRGSCLALSHLVGSSDELAFMLALDSLGLDLILILFRIVKLLVEVILVLFIILYDVQTRLIFLLLLNVYILFFITQLL